MHLCLRIITPLNFQKNTEKNGVYCFATTPGLMTDLRELGIPCRLSPYPNYATEKDSNIRTECRRIGIFGHQRQDKDDGLLLPLLDILLANEFQATFQNSGKNSIVLEHPDLNKLDRFIQPEQFLENIRSCDAVVNTCNPESFSNRLSGISIDSLCDGVPLVAPANTHMSRLAIRFNAGYIINSVQSILLQTH